MKKQDFHLPPYARSFKRGGPAIILPKDIGMILSYTGISKDSTVVEAGSGSGFLTSALARVAKHVTTYEIKPEFHELARENVRRLNLSNVSFKLADVMQGIEEKDVDIVVLDMPESNKVVSHAHSALLKNGFLVGYLPNVEQVKDFHAACTPLFSDVFAIECIIREYEIRDRGVRPQHFGLMHTAYLVFAKK